MRRRTRHRWMPAGLLLAALAAGAAARDSAEDPFMANLDSAMETAHRSGKLLLIYVRTDWCAACLEMKRATWSDARVREAMEPFVAVSLDGDDHPQLVMDYELEFYPGLVIADPEGRPLLILDGFRSAEETVGHLRATLERRAELETWVRGDLVRLAEFARERHATEYAERLYRRVVGDERPIARETDQRARLGLAAILIDTHRCGEASALLDAPQLRGPISEALARARKAAYSRLRGCRERQD